MRFKINEQYVPGMFSKIQKKISLRHIQKPIVRFILYVLLFDIAFVFLYPFMYALMTSFKSPTDILDLSINWIPRTIYYQNYIVAYQILKYPTRILSTLIIVIFATIGHVFSCSSIGYGISRFSYKGRNILFFISILSIIIPVQTIIIPLYKLYSFMKLIDSRLSLILPCFFGFGLRGGIFVFIFRQFYSKLPLELEDAARIDGSGFFRTFFHIVLPMSKSAIVVSSILSMVWHWNDYYEPLAYIRTSEKYPITILVDNLFRLFSLRFEQSMQVSPQLREVVYGEGIIMASIMITILPVILVFLFIQKNFVEGVERTGLSN